MVGLKECRNGWADLAAGRAAEDLVVVVLAGRVAEEALADPAADDPVANDLGADDLKVGAVDLAGPVAPAPALATGSAPASRRFAAC